MRTCHMMPARAPMSVSNAPTFDASTSANKHAWWTALLPTARVKIGFSRTRVCMGTKGSLTKTRA